MCLMCSVRICCVESNKWESKNKDFIWSFLWATSTMRQVSFPVCVINYSLFICCCAWIIHTFHSSCALSSQRPESVNVSVCRPQESDGSLPYLLVLCGDHGMSETGSHGGSSEPEVNTPLLLISPAFKRKGKLHHSCRNSNWRGGFDSFYSQGRAFFSLSVRSVNTISHAASAAPTRLFFFERKDWRHSGNMNKLQLHIET